MNIKRRNFIHLSTLVAGAAVTSGFQSDEMKKDTGSKNAALKTSGVLPISVDERKQRIAKAQHLLLRNKIDALILEPGTSLEYFTGISWWPSERTMVAVIPSQGDIIYVCPGFEEPRFRELITIGNRVIIWQEDENPFSKIVDAINETGTSNKRIGIEEELRFFIYDGISKQAPHLEYVTGDPITIPCRMIKSAAEITLMQKATDITIAAMTLGMKSLKEGVSPSEISAIVNKAHREMGATPDFALILFGTASALPHGSVKPQQLKKGDIVLMDCGCRVEGYSSDITRTIIFGARPTKRQQDIWDLEQKSQLAGFSAARIGDACENVDMAARKVITDAGMGPGYKLPGLPHRTGHGIGMDGHEWAYMVKGDKQVLQPGMCFSIEPTIAIPGEFGVRLEDCVYMTADGPEWFSQPAISIDKPFS